MYKKSKCEELFWPLGKEFTPNSSAMMPTIYSSYSNCRIKGDGGDQQLWSQESYVTFSGVMDLCYFHSSLLLFSSPFWFMSNPALKSHLWGLFYTNTTSNYSLSHLFENKASVKGLHKGNLFGKLSRGSRVIEKGTKKKKREKNK